MTVESRRRRVIAALLAVVLIVAAAALLLARPGDDELPDDAAFRMDDEVMTVAELEERVDVLESLYGVAAPSSAEESADFRKATAQSIALSMILDDAADERDIVIADKAASDVLDRIIKSEFPDLGRAGYVKTLGNSGVTEGDVIAEIKRQIAIQQLFDVVTHDVSVSEADVRAAFDDRRSELGAPESRRISNIVVRSRGEATMVANRLKRGAAFPVMVKRYSLDSSTRSTAGDLGFVTQAQLEPAFGRAAFAIRPGQVFGPVQSQHGWNVGVVEQTRPAKAATYAEVAETLKARLQSERALETWQEFLQDELDQADVDYADAYRPDDPDALPETDPLMTLKESSSD